MGKQRQSGGDLPLALPKARRSAAHTKKQYSKAAGSDSHWFRPHPTSFPGPASSSHYPRRGAGPPPRPGLVPENASGVTRARGPRTARGASQEFGFQILVSPIQPNPGPGHSPSGFPGFARSRHDRLRPRGGDIARIMKDAVPASAAASRVLRSGKETKRPAPVPPQVQRYFARGLPAQTLSTRLLTRVSGPRCPLLHLRQGDFTSSV